MSSCPTALVVEDELLLLKILQTELEASGVDVISATNGEQALHVLHDPKQQIDLLLTDIRLPGAVDGWSVAEQARAIDPDLAVIYVTGYSATPLRQVSDSVFILKPFRPSAIVAAARELGIFDGSRRVSG